MKHLNDKKLLKSWLFIEWCGKIKLSKFHKFESPSPLKTSSSIAIEPPNSNRKWQHSPISQFQSCANWSPVKAAAPSDLCRSARACSSLFAALILLLTLHSIYIHVESSRALVYIAWYDFNSRDTPAAERCPFPFSAHVNQLGCSHGEHCGLELCGLQQWFWHLFYFFH